MLVHADERKTKPAKGKREKGLLSQTKRKGKCIPLLPGTKKSPSTVRGRGSGLPHTATHHEKKQPLVNDPTVEIPGASLLTVN